MPRHSSILSRSTAYPARRCSTLRGCVPEVLDSPNGRLSFLDFNQLTYSAQALCGEPALGLVLGQRLNVSAHGILGYAVLSSANLGKAIQFALKYYRVLGLAYELELVLDDGRAELRAVESMPLGAASVFAAEGLMATLYSIACFLVGEPLQDVRVGFAYPPPAHARRYAEVFGVAAEFEQPWHWLSMPSEYLNDRWRWPTRPRCRCASSSARRCWPPWTSRKAC